MAMEHRGGTWATLYAVVTATALVAGLTTGCASQPAQPAQPVALAPAPPPPPPEPSLRTTGDAQLTLFGEFPEKARIPFHARPASPMTQHTFATEGADFDVDTSPDGKMLVFSSTQHFTQPDLYLKAVDGRAVTQLTSDPAGDVQPCFSPDGQRIAFASYRSGNWDLWMVGLDGGQATQITRSPQHEVHPSFSPDGTRLVFCLFNDKSSQWELWTLDLTRPSSRKMIGLGLFPEWSPTGDSIVYQKARERGGRWFSIWRVDLELGEPKFPIEVASSSDMALIQPSWSPDGQWITYGTARLGSGADHFSEGTVPTMTRGDIWVVRADGSDALQLTDGAGAHFASVWSVDDRIYFTSLQNGLENTWSVKPYLAAGSPAPTPAASGDKAAGTASGAAATAAMRPEQGG